MTRGENDGHSSKRARHPEVYPKQANITVDHLSPAVLVKKINLSPFVIMKKMKLISSDASGLANVTDFLPELADADESQDVENQRSEECAESAEPAENEEIPFIHTLTAEEVNNHVQQCLEMSSENKINLKNAFALKLIDCFSLLQKKKDFSVMACTLDAGTKIYSCRVDALHQQVMRLADEVVVKERRTDKEHNADDALRGKSSSKHQKRGRNNKFIATSETLTRKMKGKDPKDKYLRFEALPGAILSGARRDSNDLSLSLERYTPFWPDWENYKPLKADGKVSLPDIKIIREMPETPPISEPDPHQANTEHSFDDNDDDANHVFSETSPSEELFTVVDIATVSEPYNRIDVDSHALAGGEKENVGRSGFGEEEVGVVSTAMDRLREEAEAEGVSRAPTRSEALKILFDVSSEYDYLNMKARNYWAGPQFWKRPQDRTRGVKQNGKASIKKKEPEEIVYDLKNMDEHLIKLSKKSTRLSSKTIQSWGKNNQALPKDLKVDLSWFLNLFHLENCGGKSEESEVPQNTDSYVNLLDNFEEAEEVANDLTDPFSQCHENTSSSQDPLNATFYEAAPGQSVNSDPRDPLDSTFYDARPSNKESGKIIRVEVSSSITSDFGDSSMVPVPKMIKVNPIKYSTRPIRVDMQHLKHAMLEVIKEGIERDAREKEFLDDGLAAARPEVKFRDVLKSLPKKLERVTREDVSVAIAVTAVLSLANENSLQLESREDGDFVVRFTDASSLLSELGSSAASRFKVPMAR